MYHATLRMTDAEDFAFQFRTLNNDGTVPADFPARVFRLEVSDEDGSVLLALTEGNGLQPTDATGAVDVLVRAAEHGLTPGRYLVGCAYSSTGSVTSQPFTGTLIVSAGNLS
jgi:hypothetical protein